MTSAETLDLTDFRAVLFDLDGVLTPTAEVHMRAWRQLFTDFLADQSGDHPDLAPYVESDYFDYIDGKPRYEGVRSFLESRGIELPDGEPSDPPSAPTVCGLGNRKNDAFAAVLADEGVKPYPGSVAFLDRVDELGLAVAVVSSSRNAPAVLTAAGLDDRFSVVVDGAVAAADGLAGKPHPDTFLAAAEQLGCTAADSIVVEDALSGVAAGRAGAFGLVIGVDRGVGADRLRESGADLVVSDLGELVTR